MAYIGRQLTQGEFIKLDSIQSAFDGSETTFDLKATGQAYSPGAANALLVSLAGVIQESGIAYTVDDSQITFTTAPTSDAEVFILAMGSRVNVGTPSAGTINGSTLVDGSVGANKIAGSSINAAKLSSSFGTYGGTISATAFAGDGSALTGIANTADINAGTLNVVGVTTVGSGITLSPDGDGFFTGVVTATSYAGDGSALTGIAATANVRTGILDVSGIATFRDNIIATTASFSSDVSIAGTVSIGGTLTYEDVTNVDSVGLITARSGIKVGSGITLSSDGDIFAVGVSTATTVEDTKGNLRNIPQNSQSSAYSLVAADAGKHVSISSGGVTIPASTFSTGDAITIINNSGSDQTITCSAVTTYLANDTSTKSSLTLKARGVCTFIFVSASIVYGAGAGLE